MHRPVNLALSVDGQPYLTSIFAVAPPYNALFSRLSGDYPVVNALRTSNSAIRDLLQHFGIVQFSQEDSTAAQMDVDASAAVPAQTELVGQVMRADLPPQPIPLRVHRRVNLGQYRFETFAFPISQNGCTGEIQGVPLPQSGVRSWPAFPDQIGFPTEEAASFATAATGTYLHNMSNDTDLTLVVHRAGAQSVVSASLSPRYNIVLSSPGSITVPLERLDTPEASVSAAIDPASDTADAPAAQTKAEARVVLQGPMPSGPLLDLDLPKVNNPNGSPRQETPGLRRTSTLWISMDILGHCRNVRRWEN